MFPRLSVAVATYIGAAGVFVLLEALPTIAAGACSREDVDHYLSRGFTPEQIVKLCDGLTPRDTPSSAPSRPTSPSTPAAPEDPKTLAAQTLMRLIESNSTETNRLFKTITATHFVKDSRICIRSTSGRTGVYGLVQCDEHRMFTVKVNFDDIVALGFVNDDGWFMPTGHRVKLWIPPEKIEIPGVRISDGSRWHIYSIELRSRDDVAEARKAFQLLTPNSFGRCVQVSTATEECALADLR